MYDTFHLIRIFLIITKTLIKPQKLNQFITKIVLQDHKAKFKSITVQIMYFICLKINFFNIQVLPLVNL